MMVSLHFDDACLITLRTLTCFVDTDKKAPTTNIKIDMAPRSHSLTMKVATLLLLILADESSAWSSSSSTSRREVFSQTASAAFGLASVASMAGSALAVPSEETPRVVTRMGGNLEAYQERGLRIMAPSGKTRGIFKNSIDGVFSNSVCRSKRLE